MKLISNIKVRLDYLLIFFPLLLIKGYTINLPITSSYIILSFFLLLVHKYRFEKFDIKLPFIFVWLFLIVWGFFILLKSPVRSDGVEYYIYTVVIPFLFFTFINNIDLSTLTLERFFRVLFFSGFVLGIVSIVIFISESFSTTIRIHSLWEGWNTFSACMMVIFFFNLSFLINYSKKDGYLVYYCITLFVNLCAIFLTQTRGVWLATILAIAIFVIKRPKILFPAIILFGFFFLIFSPVIMDRYLSIVNFTEDLSALGRIQAWIASIQLLKLNFLWGYGFNGFYFNRDSVMSFFLVPVIHSHNTFLRGLVEMGFIGAVPYFFFFFTAFYYSFKFKDSIFSAENKKFIDGLQLTFVGLFIVFNFEPYFSTFDNTTIFVWMFISLAFAFHRKFIKSIEK